MHEQQVFVKVMDDDFNTANAISVLYQLAKLANQYLMETHTSTDVINEFLTYI